MKKIQNIKYIRSRAGHSSSAKEKHAVVRHEIYKYAVVHTSDGAGGNCTATRFDLGVGST